MREVLTLVAGLLVGTIAAALLLGLPSGWAGAVGLFGGVAFWYVVWGRHDLAEALRRRQN